MNIALLTAGGVGSRMHQDIPKQFLHVRNKPILIYTLEAFQTHPSIDVIIAVGLEGWIDIIWAYARQYNITKLKYVVAGGETGQDSILNGILELKKYYADSDIVLIHDGNRPLISQDIISNNLAVQKKYGSAVAAIPCMEAVFESDDKISSETNILRDKLLRTQTPHAYTLQKLVWVHEERIQRNITHAVATCDLMCFLGEKVYFSQGSEKNIKITTVDDIEIFTALLNTSKEQGIK